MDLLKEAIRKEEDLIDEYAEILEQSYFCECCDMQVKTEKDLKYTKAGDFSGYFCADCRADLKQLKSYNKKKMKEEDWK